ncbi:hypothetical protein A4A49_25118 [Nicotiana attenuata]|uniref:Uncharacterized protein n=1 Tax=Nicotiana attenuata TaxID=49451 RepID=A0A314KHP5_NICAT|nr:hypothetical protein A4A49_25118 [Nicotiana attenuata]
MKRKVPNNEAGFTFPDRDRSRRNQKRPGQRSEVYFAILGPEQLLALLSRESLILFSGGYIEMKHHK